MTAPFQPAPLPPPEGSTYRYLRELVAWIERMLRPRQEVRIASSATAPVEDYPFRLSVELDPSATPTFCTVTVSLGTLKGPSALDGSGDPVYLEFPLFEGASGDLLNADPAPSYDIPFPSHGGSGTTTKTVYFYLRVNTNAYGRILVAYIFAWETGDAAVVDVPFVHPDTPDIGDPGNDGAYFLLINSVTITLTGATPNVGLAIGTPNVQTSLGFYTCADQGRFYRT